MKQKKNGGRPEKQATDPGRSRDRQVRRSPAAQIHRYARNHWDARQVGREVLSAHMKMCKWHSAAWRKTLSAKYGPCQEP
eukprot:4627009-Pyramimonas_sp.AAC.1